MRRDALAYDELAVRAVGEAEVARMEARERLSDARAELRRIGTPAVLEPQLEELEATLPPSIELPRSAPPSAAQRLARAGVTVSRPPA